MKIHIVCYLFQKNVAGHLQVDYTIDWESQDVIRRVKSTICFPVAAKRDVKQTNVDVGREILAAGQVVPALVVRTYVTNSNTGNELLEDSSGEESDSGHRSLK